VLEEADIARVSSISKENLLSFYDKYINPSSPRRSVLSIPIKSQTLGHTFDSPQNTEESEFVTNEGYNIPSHQVFKVNILTLVLLHNIGTQLRLQMDILERRVLW